MKHLFSFVAVSVASMVFAQKTDCASVKSELLNIKLENAELQKQNHFYKETLNLLLPVKTANVDGLKIDITKAVGSRSEKKIILTEIYTVTENKIRPIAATDRITVVDPRGNQYQSVYIKMGADDRLARDVQYNIPMKFTTDFLISEGEFPVIKQLTLYLLASDSLSNKIPVSFENIPVSWQ